MPRQVPATRDTDEQGELEFSDAAASSPMRNGIRPAVALLSKEKAFTPADENRALSTGLPRVRSIRRMRERSSEKFTLPSHQTTGETSSSSSQMEPQMDAMSRLCARSAQAIVLSNSENDSRTRRWRPHPLRILGAPRWTFVSVVSVLCGRIFRHDVHATSAPRSAPRFRLHLSKRNAPDLAPDFAAAEAKFVQRASPIFRLIRRRDGAATTIGSSGRGPGCLQAVW